MEYWAFRTIQILNFAIYHLRIRRNFSIFIASFVRFSTHKNNIFCGNIFNNQNSGGSPERIECQSNMSKWGKIVLFVDFVHSKCQINSRNVSHEKFMQLLQFIILERLVKREKSNCVCSMYHRQPSVGCVSPNM